MGPTFPPSPEASAGHHSFSDGGRSGDEAFPSMPDLKVGPKGDVGSASEDPGAPSAFAEAPADKRPSSSDSGNSGGAPSAAPSDLPSE